MTLFRPTPPLHRCSGALSHHSLNRLIKTVQGPHEPSTLTVGDAEDIEKKVAGVTTVMYATRSVLQVIRENKNWSTAVLRTTSEFPDIRNWPVVGGIGIMNILLVSVSLNPIQPTVIARDEPFHQ